MSAGDDVFIYALCEPDTGAVRYIGQTTLNVYVRLYIHCKDTHNAHKRRWLDELRRRGQQPRIMILQTVSKGDAFRVEREEIARHIAAGCDLLNMTMRQRKPVRHPTVRQRRTEKVTIRLADRDGALLERVADEERVPAAVLVRQILMSDLKKRPEAQQPKGEHEPST